MATIPTAAATAIVTAIMTAMIATARAETITRTTSIPISIPTATRTDIRERTGTTIPSRSDIRTDTSRVCGTAKPTVTTDTAIARPTARRIRTVATVTAL